MKYNDYDWFCFVLCRSVSRDHGLVVDLDDIDLSMIIQPTIPKAELHSAEIFSTEYMDSMDNVLVIEHPRE